MKIPQPLCENISSVGGWLAPTVPAPGGRQGNTGRGPNTGKENTLITGWGNASLFHIRCKGFLMYIFKSFYRYMIHTLTGLKKQEV